MIHHGDCLDVLKTLDAYSIDACVTDPPYELGFMGKSWDRSSIAYNLDLWCAVLRVLKPGAHLLAFGGTRTSHRMVCAIEDAGFEIRDSLCWLYGSGFPKSLDVGKAIDKRAGAERTVVGSKGGRYATPIRGLAAGDSIVGRGSNGTHDASDITAPATDAAKQWAGWGTALKPAHEPIVLARKPFAGSVAANVLQHGTSALNIDACRIGDNVETWPVSRGYSRHDPGSTIKETQPTGDAPDGRWPANVLMDESVAAMLDEQTGELTAATSRTDTDSRNEYFAKGGTAGVVYQDRGGASRFYYIAKPSREERDFGTHGLPTRQRDESRKDGNQGGDNPRNRGLQQRGNFHPTVKPVELMRWLVRLVTPPGGLVLDPFLGSGTTGMACRYEHRQFIGIEREAEYIAIAERRIAAVAPLFAEQETA